MSDIDPKLKEFVSMVRKESDANDDVWLRDRIMKTEIFRELEKDYDNILEVLEFAIKRTNLRERVKADLKKWWEFCKTERSYKDDSRLTAELLAFSFEVQSSCDGFLNLNTDAGRFIKKYSKAELINLAEEVAKESPWKE